MSWRDEIKKEKFQGPKRQGADYTPSSFQLGLKFKAVNYVVNNIEKRIDSLMDELKVGEPVNQLHISRLETILGSVDLMKEKIEEVDEMLLESAKYSQRIDSDTMYLEGAKYRNPDGSLR